MFAVCKMLTHLYSLSFYILYQSINLHISLDVVSLWKFQG